MVFLRRPAERPRRLRASVIHHREDIERSSVNFAGRILFDVLFNLVEAEQNAELIVVFLSARSLA